MTTTKPLYARVPEEVHAHIHGDTPAGMTPARFAGVLLALGWEAWQAKKTTTTTEGQHPAGADPH